MRPVTWIPGSGPIWRGSSMQAFPLYLPDYPWLELIWSAIIPTYSAAWRPLFYTPSWLKILSLNTRTSRRKPLNRSTWLSEAICANLKNFAPTAGTGQRNWIRNLLTSTLPWNLYLTFLLNSPWPSRRFTGGWPCVSSYSNLIPLAEHSWILYKIANFCESIVIFENF